MNPMFDDDFFSGFGMTPFGMGRLRRNSGSERQPAQRSGAFGHPFFDQRAQDQQLREQQQQQQMEEQRRQEDERHQAEEEDRRRRMLQQRRQQQQQQQRVDPFAQMFGASPQQQQQPQRRSPPPRIAIPPSLAQNPQFQRLSPRQQQEFLRQVLARQEQQEQQEAEQQRMQQLQQMQQQQQQRRSPPPRMAIPASVAQNPQFQRLSPRQQQEFVRQLAAKQEQQEQEQFRQLQLQQQQQQRAEQAEAQRREQVLADALQQQQQQQQMEAAAAAQAQRARQIEAARRAQQQQQHRMVCDQTQTSDDEEAEPAPHRTVDEGTETEGGNIKQGVATETETETAPVEPASPAFMDCTDAGMANAEENAGPVADDDFADCAETEQEAAVMQKEIEEASHASTVSSDEDMGLDEGDEAAPSGEAQAGEAAAEAEEEEATVSPMKSLEEIEAIKKEADEVAAHWAPEAFVSRNPKTNDAVKKARAFYSEGLLQCVIKLDGVDSLGDSNVRQARKSAVNAMERKVEELKEWGQKHDVLA